MMGKKDQKMFNRLAQKEAQGSKAYRRAKTVIMSKKINKANKEKKFNRKTAKSKRDKHHHPMKLSKEK